MAKKRNAIIGRNATFDLPALETKAPLLDVPEGKEFVLYGTFSVGWVDRWKIEAFLARPL
jgi:hypothetical protein